MKYIFIFFILISSDLHGQDLELVVNNKRVNSDTTIILTAKEKSLHFFIKTRGDFSYQLYPQETSWIKLDSNNYCNYNQLVGKEYKLLIRNNYTNKIIRTCSLEIEKPFYLTWFFLFSMLFFGAMILGMIIYFFLLYKFRQQAKLQKVRNNIAADLHDDVGATLTSIGFFGELIRQKIINRAEPADILPLLSKVIDSSKESVETMRGVVWTINPNNDFAKDFFERLKYYANEMLATKSVALNFEIEGIEQQELGIEVQRNLFLFFKEAINNVLKHAKAKTATVNIKMENRKFWMKISDDGVGFDLNENFEGHGLGSLRKRIENLNGAFEIKSEVNVGTTLEVSIFLP
ncbi:sensor histidine kinase [Lacihabitans soyangensis]|uniref:Histidine kinase domain-containing protein n=1 Tax=Lacihabitans soyangensis TaxID=869394 RepID=A0AAE3KVG9_9BACT|nr:histidine kinase [Lacihabitans soyangensis]MCP9766044.1 hypothetical protein [Lacihabitans soyangensis]